MSRHDEAYERALAKLLSDHVEQGVPDEVDIWPVVNQRLTESENASESASMKERHSWWRNFTVVALGSGSPKAESKTSGGIHPRVAFAMGIAGLALLTLLTTISIGQLAQRGRGGGPAPIPTNSPGIPTPIKAWNVLVSSDYTDLFPLLIGSPSDVTRVRPFGSIAVGEDGNFWFLDGDQILQLNADGSATTKFIHLDTRIRSSETTYQDSYNGLALEGSNFWLLDGYTAYKVAANGALLQEYHPLPIPVGGATTSLPSVTWPALRTGENGQILVEQPDGTYLKADTDFSNDPGKPQPTPFPGYPFGGKFYSHGTAPIEIIAGSVPVTIDVPGTINGRHILKVLPDGSFCVLVQAVAARIPDVVDGAYTYVMHYDADGKLIERARLLSPIGAGPNVWQVAAGPDGKFYAEAADLLDVGRVDLVQLRFYPASQPLPPVPTPIPTPILPTPLPTIEMPRLPSPIPSIAAQAPTTAPTPPGQPTTEVVDVPGAKGVSVRLIHQEQAAVTGVGTGNCGTEMTWVLQIENAGNNPFVADIDKSSLTMTDETGKTHPLSQACGGLPYSGSFAQRMTINSGDNLTGYIAFQADDIPSSAHYLTLRFTLSGMQVILSYDLTRQSPQ